MREGALRYLPAGAFALGAVFTVLIGKPEPMPLRKPLTAAAPAEWMGAPAKEVPIAADEVEASGVSDYLSREYEVAPDAAVGLYIGYHATQQGDKRMHSPTLCLPGSGWTPVNEATVPVPLANRTVNVNRFILQNGSNRILVYYWFQGRGRITSGQSELKLNAMRDALLTHRDDEALVRIVVPITGSEKNPVGSSGVLPDTLATRLASTIIGPIEQALPAAP
jgi:EpsI family protein